MYPFLNDEEDQRPDDSITTREPLKDLSIPGQIASRQPASDLSFDLGRDLARSMEWKGSAPPAVEMEKPNRSEESVHPIEGHPLIKFSLDEPQASGSPYANSPMISDPLFRQNQSYKDFGSELNAKPFDSASFVGSGAGARVGSPVSNSVKAAIKKRKAPVGPPSMASLRGNAIRDAIANRLGTIPDEGGNPKGVLPPIGKPSSFVGDSMMNGPGGSGDSMDESSENSSDSRDSMHSMDSMSKTIQAPPAVSVPQKETDSQQQRIPSDDGSVSNDNDYEFLKALNQSNGIINTGQASARMSYGAHAPYDPAGFYNNMNHQNGTLANVYTKGQDRRADIMKAIADRNSKNSNLDKTLANNIDVAKIKAQAAQNNTNNPMKLLNNFNDPILKQSRINHASLSKAETLLNGNAPLTAQSLADINNDIVSGMSLRPNIITEGKLKRTEYDNLNTKIANLRQKYGNQMVDLRTAAPEVVDQMRKVLSILKDDYAKGINDSVDNISNRVKAFADPTYHSKIDAYGNTFRVPMPSKKNENSGDNIISTEDGKKWKIDQYGNYVEQ